MLARSSLSTLLRLTRRPLRAIVQVALASSAAWSVAQSTSHYDAQNNQPNSNQPGNTLRPDITTDAKTTDTKPSSEEKPHIFKPMLWGPHNEYKLQFGGDTRIRFEDRHNYDMRDEVGDNDKLGFLRTRLNWDLTYGEFQRAFLEIVDGREIDAREFQAQEDYVDLHQLFMEWKDPCKGPWGIRVGRQEMEFGRDRRLVEASNWVNLRRRYDGARLMYRSEEVDADVFLVQPDYYEVKRGDQTFTAHGRRRTEELFYGSYFTLKQFKPHTIEAYFLGLSDTEEHRTFPRPVRSEDGLYGSQDRYTVGTAMYGPLWKREGCGTLSYDFEGAYQFGHRSTDEIRSWMLHGDVNYQWDDPWKPKLSLLGNLASGDRKSEDGENNTFNPLFGAGHAPYGIIDLTRLQNLREVALVSSVEPTEKLKAEVQLHRFWLDSKTDSWYDNRGNSLGRDVEGNSGRGLGDEIDAIVTYKLTKFVTLEAGAAHFVPNGDFAHNVNRTDGANLVYLQTMISF